MSALKNLKPYNELCILMKEVGTMPVMRRQ